MTYSIFLPGSTPNTPQDEITLLARLAAHARLQVEPPAFMQSKCKKEQGKD